MTTTAKPPRSARTRSAAARVRPDGRARDSRAGAVPSPEMVNVFEESRATPTSLLAKAWVRNVAYDKRVWLDVDLLSGTGEPVASDTLPLRYLEPAGGTGDFFLGEVSVPRSRTAARRTAVREVRYRLYYEVDGQVFTDGFCHQHPL